LWAPAPASPRPDPGIQRQVRGLPGTRTEWKGTPCAPADRGPISAIGLSVTDGSLLGSHDRDQCRLRADGLFQPLPGRPCRTRPSPRPIDLEAIVPARASSRFADGVVARPRDVTIRFSAGTARLAIAAPRMARLSDSLRREVKTISSGRQRNPARDRLTGGFRQPPRHAVRSGGRRKGSEHFGRNTAAWPPARVSRQAWWRRNRNKSNRTFSTFVPAIIVQVYGQS